MYVVVEKNLTSVHNVVLRKICNNKDKQYKNHVSIGFEDHSCFNHMSGSGSNTLMFKIKLQNCLPS